MLLIVTNLKRFLGLLVNIIYQNVLFVFAPYLTTYKNTNSKTYCRQVYKNNLPTNVYQIFVKSLIFYVKNSKT